MFFKFLGIAIGSILLASCARSASLRLIADTAIIGGHSAELSDSNDAKFVARSTVALMGTFEGRFRQFCAGTLVSADLVLTAAHCAQKLPLEKLNISFGAKIALHDRSLDLVKAESLIINPEFSEASFPFEDVAVIKLKDRAPNDYQPASLLSEAYGLRAGDVALIAGFGAVEQRGDVMTLPDSLHYTTVRIAKFDSKNVVVDQRSGRGACAGDSGGPAFLKIENDLYLFGATKGPYNFTRECNQFAAFTYVSKYERFILNASKQLGAIPPMFVRP